MSIKTYISYINEHRRNYIEATKEFINNKNKTTFTTERKIDDMKLHISAMFHDLSKYGSAELKPYYAKFYLQKDLDKDSLEYETIEIDFQLACDHHYAVNPHHPEYWDKGGEIDMPRHDIICCIIDWMAMAKKFGGSAQEFYLKNYYKYNFSRKTRMAFEVHLDLTYHFDSQVDLYEELLCLDELYEYRNGDLNSICKSSGDKYNVDIEKFVKDAIDKKTGGKHGNNSESDSES